MNDFNVLGLPDHAVKESRERLARRTHHQRCGILEAEPCRGRARFRSGSGFGDISAAVHVGGNEPLPVRLFW
jgi:hypothetical protein